MVAAELGGGGVQEHRRQRAGASVASPDPGPVRVGSELFPFLFFFLINHGEQPTVSVNVMINRDLSTEAVALPASIEPKRSPPLKLL
jgi:hypothetical protein